MEVQNHCSPVGVEASLQEVGKAPTGPDRRQPAGFPHIALFFFSPPQQWVGLVPKKMAVETGALLRVADTPKRAICAGCDQEEKRGRENQEDGKALDRKKDRRKQEWLH